MDFFKPWVAIALLLCVAGWAARHMLKTPGAIAATTQGEVMSAKIADTEQTPPLVARMRELKNEYEPQAVVELYEASPYAAGTPDDAWLRASAELRAEGLLAMGEAVGAYAHTYVNSMDKAEALMQRLDALRAGGGSDYTARLACAVARGGLLMGYWGGVEKMRKQLELARELGNEPAIAGCRAHMMRHLAFVLLKAKRMDEAWNIFADMAGLGDSGEALFWRAETAEDVVFEDKAEMRSKAYAALLAMPRNEGHVWQCITTTTHVMIRTEGEAKHLAAARALWDNMESLPFPPDFESERAYTARAMFEAYYANDLPREAAKILSFMESLKVGDERNQALVQHAINAAKEFAQEHDERKTRREQQPAEPNMAQNVPAPEASDTQNNAEASERFWSAGGEFWSPDEDDFDDLPASLQGRRYTGRNFWQQPSKGRAPGELGLSDAFLDTWEKSVGFPLPRLYREHMKRQNGGLLHFESFVDATGRIHSVFINSAMLDPLPTNGVYTPLAENFDYLLNYGDEVFGEGHILDRLYVISYMYGHSILCLDYGFSPRYGGGRGTEPFKEPVVRLFDTEDDDSPPFVVDEDKLRLLVVTPEYAFATHWKEKGGYARLEDIVCASCYDHDNGTGDLYLWARKKADSIVYGKLSLEKIDWIMALLLLYSPAYLGFDPKLKRLRFFNYRAYVKACLARGKEQREAEESPEFIMQETAAKGANG